MSVDAAEAEGVDSRAARGRAVAVKPRARLGVEEEPPRLQFQVRVRLLGVQRRRQRPVVEGECRLDKGGRRGPWSQVANHGLDTAKGDRRQFTVARPEAGSQGVHLGPIAEWNTGAVRFHQGDGGGCQSCGLVSAADGQLLALRAWGEQARSVTVAGGRNLLEQRVDAVAVALGITAALEHDHAAALAQHGPLGLFRKRGNLAATAERAQLAEELIDERQGASLHATGEHSIEAAGTQLPHAVLDHDETRGASRVEGVRRSLEVEAVRNAAGQATVHQSGGDLAVKRRQTAFQLIADEGELRRGAVRFQAAQHFEELVEGEPLEHYTQDAAIGEDAAAQEHTGFLAVERQVPGPSVGERLVSGPQSQELIRLRSVDGVGHHPILDGVEPRQVAEVAASSCVNRLGHAAVLERVPFRQRAGFRFGQAIDLGDDVLPELHRRVGLRENAGHADDGDVLSALRHGRWTHRKVTPVMRFSSSFPLPSSPSRWPTTRLPRRNHTCALIQCLSLPRSTRHTVCKGPLPSAP